MKNVILTIFFSRK